MDKYYYHTRYIDVTAANGNRRKSIAGSVGVSFFHAVNNQPTSLKRCSGRVGRDEGDKKACDLNSRHRTFGNRISENVRLRFLLCGVTVAEKYERMNRESIS